MVNTQNSFPETRFRHCHNVGLKMYSYAKNVLNWDENRCKDMYLLGLSFKSKKTPTSMRSVGG